MAYRSGVAHGGSSLGHADRVEWIPSGDALEQVRGQPRGGPSAPLTVVDDDDIPLAEDTVLILPLPQGRPFRWGIGGERPFDAIAARPTPAAVAASSNCVVAAGAGRGVPAAEAAARAAARATPGAPPEARRQMGLRGRRYVEHHHELARLAGWFEVCLPRAATSHRSIVGKERLAHDALPSPADGSIPA